MKNCTDNKSYYEVQEQGDSYHLYHVLMHFCSEVLRAEHGSSDVDDFEYEESKHDYLIDYTYGSHTFVRILAQHDGIHCAQHHNQ
jgi:hypothetical protein